MSENWNREPGTVFIPTWRAFDSYEDLYIGERSSAAYALLAEDLPVCGTDLERVGRVWVDEGSPELDSAITNTLAQRMWRGDGCAELLAHEVDDDVRLSYARHVLQDAARDAGIDERHPNWPTPGYPRKHVA